MEFKISCLKCGHKAIKEFLYDYRNINTLINKFLCSICHSKEIEIYSLNGDLIYSVNHVTLCEECGNPIIEPRLKCMPTARLCVLCQSGERVKENLKEEETIRSQSLSKSCPCCGSLMVERQNKSTGETFWGCARFPECSYTENLTDNEANNRSDIAVLMKKLNKYG